jgi:hypothetical protein
LVSPPAAAELARNQVIASCRPCSCASRLVLLDGLGDGVVAVLQAVADVAQHVAVADAVLKDAVEQAVPVAEIDDDGVAAGYVERVAAERAVSRFSLLPFTVPMSLPFCCVVG